MNTSEHRSEFYGGGKQPEADMPFHFLSVDLDSKLTNLIPYDKGKTILKLPPNERANKLKMKNFVVAIVGSPVLEHLFLSHNYSPQFSHFYRFKIIKF